MELPSTVGCHVSVTSLTLTAVASLVTTSHTRWSFTWISFPSNSSARCGFILSKSKKHVILLEAHLCNCNWSVYMHVCACACACAHVYACMHDNVHTYIPACKIMIYMFYHCVKSL